MEVRCNDLDGAFKKARGVVSSVMKDRQAIVTKISQAENPSKKMELQRLLSSANKSIERANDLYQQVVDLVIEREMPRIQAILKEHSERQAPTSLGGEAAELEGGTRGFCCCSRADTLGPRLSERIHGSAHLAREPVPVSPATRPAP